MTLPTITCSTGSNPGFGDVTSSTPVPGVKLADVQVQVFVDCHGGNETYGGWSTLDPNCISQGCPVENFNGGIVSPGDQVQIQASVSPDGSSTTITDLTSGASLSWTSSLSVTSSTGA
ncbi:MAG: hypothetical protein ACRDVW_07075 [Acidimicrobiales bacterium]